MGQILVFGDSITYGKFDFEGGWVARLRRYVDERNSKEKHFNYLVYNLGIPGSSTAELISRVDFETKQRLLYLDCIVIISGGINDSQFLVTQKKFRTDPARFRKNVETLVEISKRVASKTLYLGLPPVNEDKLDKTYASLGLSYSNENILKYNEIIRKACAAAKVNFVDVYDHLVRKGYVDTLLDGLHPDGKGHRIMFETVQSALTDLRIL